MDSRFPPFVQSTPVLIVGSGPIGLALATDLGQRGVPCTLIEKNDRRLGPAKMILVSVRSMEFCRRWGVAEQVWNWGFPRDFCLDNVFVAGGLQGHEFARIPMLPMGAPRESEFSPERQAHCPQTWFDPILREKAESYPHVQLRYRHKLERFVQDEDSVTAEVTDLDTGERHFIRSRYLVGCDGYLSTVRKQLGVGMRGEPYLDTSINIELDIEDLSALHHIGNAGRYIMVGPEGTWATFIAVDGKRTWRVTLYGANDVDVDNIDIDAAIRRCVGRDFKYRINSVGKWVRRMVVADRFRDGRVFLAGDAAHTHPPNGGFGMNTGLGDAVDLGWKLDATLAGWGGPHLLESYDMERRPVCHRAANESLLNYRRLTAKTSHPSIEADDAQGRATRAALGERLRNENTKAWQPLGIHLGYVYSPSNVVAAENSPLPVDDTIGYSPTTYPGIRAPHAWLKGGRSTLDLFGDGFVLLRFAKIDVTSLVSAAKRFKVPLRLVDIDDPQVAKLYERALVLVRPDGHVAWRGDEVAATCDALWARVTGAASTAAACTEIDSRIASADQRGEHGITTQRKQLWPA